MSNEAQPQPTTASTPKEMLTLAEAAIYMGVSKPQLYRLTAAKAIPHYKPCGKMIYFDRGELIAWIKSNRVATSNELADRANDYCMRKGGAL